MGVGSVALGDLISGEHSSLKDYLIAGFVGAVSGAIFSPFQAIKSLGGMLKLGQQQVPSKVALHSSCRVVE